MKAHTLQANKRTVVGRKVKTLRNKGVLPATIYGKTIVPLSIQVSMDEFSHVFKQTGETGLINLTVDGEIHPVLVKNVSKNPVSDIPSHVEFHQVNLKENIKANVPLVITGESEAIKEKTGTLLQLLNEVEVEALPTDLPEHIEVDISALAQVNDHVLVKALVIPGDVTILTDPDIMVVKIGELLAPEPEPTPTPAEGETTEGEGETAKETEGEEKETEEKKEASEKTEEAKKE